MASPIAPAVTVAENTDINASTRPEPPVVSSPSRYLRPKEKVNGEPEQKVMIILDPSRLLESRQGPIGIHALDLSKLGDTKAMALGRVPVQSFTLLPGVENRLSIADYNILAQQDSWQALVELGAVRVITPQVTIKNIPAQVKGLGYTLEYDANEVLDVVRDSVDLEWLEGSLVHETREAVRRALTNRVSLVKKNEAELQQKHQKSMYKQEE